MIRLIPAALAACLMFAPAASALDLENMDASEKAAFEAAVRAYLVDNPEVLVEAFDVLEARQKQTEEQADVGLIRANEADIFAHAGSWTGGNPDGDITLVEFLDYRCGYCKKAHEDVAKLVKSDGNIKFIVKEFPILGEESTLAAQFAIATRIIAGDEAYKAVNDTLMQTRASINEGTLRRVAKTLGLNADEVIAEMDSDAVLDVINETRLLAQRLKISGTPTFVMNDQMVRGYVPLKGMRQIVSEVRQD